MFPYSILAVLWLLLFHSGESKNEVNVMNGKVIRHLHIKMTGDFFAKWKGKRRESRCIFSRFYIFLFCSSSVLHFLHLLYFPFVSQYFSCVFSLTMLPQGQCGKVMQTDVLPATTIHCPGVFCLSLTQG